MNAERITRGVAGVFVLLSVSLGYFVNPWWFAFTAFVGLNLLQSAFTDWCPMLALLRKLSSRSAGAATRPGASAR